MWASRGVLRSRAPTSGPCHRIRRCSAASSPAIARSPSTGSCRRPGPCAASRGSPWKGTGLRPKSDLKRALELGPASTDVLQTYSNYLTDRGRHAEAIEAALKAESRAPLSVAASRQVAWAYYMARQHDRAIQQSRRTLEIEPGYPTSAHCPRTLAAVCRQAAEGIKELEAAGRDYEAMLAVGYAMAGRREDATRLLNQITSPTYDRASRVLRRRPDLRGARRPATGDRLAGAGACAQRRRNYRSHCRPDVRPHPRQPPIRGVRCRRWARPNRPAELASSLDPAVAHP